MKKKLKASGSFSPPNQIEGDVVEAILKWYFRPRYFGEERLNKNNPGLYVSNHTLLGITDGPIYIPRLFRKRQIYLRPLVDKMQKDIPIWRSIISHYGGVIASRDNCSVLMENKQHILVFPGGTNEAFKNEGESYKLIWKKRNGFVKMAIKHGYPIIPIASLGGDELYDVVIDKKDIMESFIGKWIKKNERANKILKGGDNIPPLVKGLGGTILPKPKRIYYTFCEPIETKHLNGEVTDEAVEIIKIKTELAIYKAIYEMTLYRKNKGRLTNSAIRNLLSR